MPPRPTRGRASSASAVAPSAAAGASGPTVAVAGRTARCRTSRGARGCALLRHKHGTNAPGTGRGATAFCGRRRIHVAPVCSDSRESSPRVVATAPARQAGGHCLPRNHRLQHGPLLREVIGSGPRSGTRSQSPSRKRAAAISRTEGRRFEPCRPCPYSSRFVACLAATRRVSLSHVHEIVGRAARDVGVPLPGAPVRRIRYGPRFLHGVVREARRITRRKGGCTS